MSRGLSAVQCFSDFANGQEGAGSRLLDFQGLFAVRLNQTDESVQDRQGYLCRLAFGRLQGFDYFSSFFGITHVDGPIVGF
jgi:hypothetical protein